MSIKCRSSGRGRRTPAGTPGTRLGLIRDPARGSHHSAGKDREGRAWRGRRQGGATLGGQKRISRWVRSGPPSRPGAWAWRARGPSTLAQARPAAHEALGHRSIREGGRQGDWARRKAESARATQLAFQMPCFPGQLNHGHISHLGAGTQASDRIPGPGNCRTCDPVSTCPEGSRGKACLDLMAGPPASRRSPGPWGPATPALASRWALSCRHAWGPGPPPPASSLQLNLPDPRSRSPAETWSHVPFQLRALDGCPTSRKASPLQLRYGRLPSPSLTVRTGPRPRRRSCPGRTSSRTVRSANTDVHASTRVTVRAAFPEPETWRRPRGPSVQADGHSNGPAVPRGAAQPRKGAPWTQATAGWGPGASATREGVEDSAAGGPGRGRCGEKDDSRVPAVGDARTGTSGETPAPPRREPRGSRFRLCTSHQRAAWRSQTHPRPPPDPETAFPA